MSIYKGPIVDAHHHFWEPSNGKIPWLKPDASIPFRYGDYSAIKTTYLPPDLKQDAKDINLVGTVSMETEWDESDPVGEMLYTTEIAHKWEWPNAAVAHARLDWPNANEILSALSAIPLVRAIRHKPGQTSSVKFTDATLMSDASWRQGYSLLSTYNLHFELQTAWWHLYEAATLANDFPNTTIIINHAGLPADRSQEGMTGWYNALKHISQLPNVAIKISGIGQPGHPWTVESNREIVLKVAECFGQERILFASNYPVDSLVGSYHDIYSGFLKITEHWTLNEQKSAFIDNALKYYRLPEKLKYKQNHITCTNQSI